MSTVKKRVNITVKKAPTPFQFPGSTSTSTGWSSLDERSMTSTSSLSSTSAKKIPMIVPKKDEKNPSPDVVFQTQTHTHSSLAGSTPTSSVASAPRRRRGRPRKQEKEPNTSETGTETPGTPVTPGTPGTPGTPVNPVTPGTQGTQGTRGTRGTPVTPVTPNSGTIHTIPKTTKKRGRKPRNNTGTTAQESKDKVYSLFEGSPTVNIDNFENLSYIVNLKITKARADAICAELQRTRFGKGIEAGAGVSAGDDSAVGLDESFAQPSHEAIVRFNNIHTRQDLASIYRMVYPEIDRRKVHPGDLGAFRTHTGTNLENLEHMEQVTIRTQMSSGYADCYVGECMPGFSIGDCWPIRSPWPCGNCDEYFTNTPAGLVRNVVGDFEVDPQNCKFYLYKNFCSWPCALRFAVDRMQNWSDQQFLLNFCYNTAEKKRNPAHRWSKIPIAPALETLRRHGGLLSIEQYRAATDSNRSYNIYLPPLIPLRMTLEESSRDLITRTSTAGGKAVRRGKSKYVPMDATRLKKAEMSIRNRKNSVRNSNMTIDKLMKMEVKTVQ